MKPSEIVAQLNRYVIGQDDAKKILAVAVYAHFRKVAMTDVDRLEMLKSNILLIGPTGTGKTLLCETLARILELPFVTADATSLAQTEYVNEELDAILQRLLERAGGDTAKAGRGIVFIDEVDKLKAISGQARAASGENVQHALLKIMEGSLVQPEERADDRYQADPVHLRRRLRRAGKHSGRDAGLRLHRHLAERRPEGARPPQRPRQADRSLPLRPDPRVRRPPADHRPPQ